MVNVLQTNKVDAQCDKLATKISWQCFASKVGNCQLPHLHLTPPAFGASVGVTQFEFYGDFQKTRARAYRVLLFARFYV